MAPPFIFDRQRRLTPENFLRLDDIELRRIGFSRQKTAYCQGIARSIQAGELELDELAELDDNSARSRLLKIKGIGNWTADNYLLMALLRPGSQKRSHAWCPWSLRPSRAREMTVIPSVDRSSDREGFAAFTRALREA